MAFGEVTPINYGQSVSYNDTLSLAAQTQDAMQQKYDVNTAKLEGIVEQISNIPIQQQAGKKYLMDKLQGVLNTVSANMKVSGGFGILSNSYTGGMVSQIKGSIDDKVKKHIKYSADIINFEKGVAKLREKDPKLYNQANYDFAQYKAGLQNYLQGDENADLGSLQYIPKKDVFGDLTKKVEDLIKIKGDQEIDIPDGNGGMIKRKMSGLKPEEVLRYMPNLIDSQDEQQLMIDGWYDMRGMKPEQIAERFDIFVNTKKTSLEGEISRISNILKTEKDTLSKEKKDNYNSQLNIYKNALSDINTTSSEVNKTSPEQVGYIFKKEQFKNTAVDMFTGNVSEVRLVDPIEKEKRDYQLSLEKLAIDKANLALNEAKAKKTEGISKNENGEYVINTEGVYQNSEADQKVPDLEFIEQYETTAKDLYNEVYRGAKDLYFEITTPESKKLEFEEDMKSQGYILNAKKDDFIPDPNYKKPIDSRAQAMARALIVADFDEIPNYAERVAKITEASQSYGLYGGALAEANAAGKIKEVKTTTTEIVGYSGEDPIYGSVVHTNGGKDISKIKAVLESKNLKPYLNNRQNLVFDAKLHADKLKSLPPGLVKGGAFQMGDGDSFETSKDSSGNIKITQKQKGNKDQGYQNTVTATITPDSYLGRELSKIVEEKSPTQVGMSTKSVPRGYTLRPIKTSSTMLYTPDKMKALDIFKAGVETIIKDRGLQVELVALSIPDNAEKIIMNTLINKGIDEDTANKMAERLVEVSKSSSFKGEIKSGLNTWGYNVMYKNQMLNQAFQAIGNGEQLSSDFNRANNSYNSQLALIQLNTYLSSSQGTKKEIERIYNIITK